MYTHCVMKKPFFNQIAFIFCCVYGLCLITDAQENIPGKITANPVVDADVVIYGGTPAGVSAAVSAADKGLSVIVVDMTHHIGGMISGGLVDTDIGDRDTVGGFARQFFEEVKNYYRDNYGADSTQYKSCRGGLMYEPSVGEKIFDRMLADKRVQVCKRYRLVSVNMNKDSDIASFVTEELDTGEKRIFNGKFFIDASYEGDLMADAGVTSRIGREGRNEYGEYLAGISVGPDKGKPDQRYQTYNFRVSITSNSENSVHFPKPENYDPSWAIPFGKRIKRLDLKEFSDLLVNGAERVGPNDKWDLNWGDIAGANEGYADGDWTTRDHIAARYRDNFLSGLYYLQNSTDLPEEWLKNMEKWGLSKNEFVDSGNFPHQMYIRQARRMVGKYVLTEQDITQNRYKPDGICAGSYGIDCHVIRIVEVNGKRVKDLTPHYYVAPYDIPYGSLVPQDCSGQPKNLFVPVCLSSTHVAYCSLRMEPVYMMLGQAAGNAAWLAIQHHQTVQSVDVSELREILRKEGALLDCAYFPQVKIEWTPRHPEPGEPVKFSVVKDEVRKPLEQIFWDFEGNGKVSATGETAVSTFSQNKIYNVSLLVRDNDNLRRWVSAGVPVGTAEDTDVTIDDSEAQCTGQWEGTFPKYDGRKPDVFLGPGMLYEESTPIRTSAVSFTPNLIKPGRYEICLAFRPRKGLAQGAVVKVLHADGETDLKIDQTIETTPFPFVSLGEFRCDTGNKSTLTLSDPGLKGRVAVDGARWIWRGE